MYLLDSNCTDAMTQESISGWQVLGIFKHSRGRPGTRLAIPSGWEGLLGVMSGQDLCSDVLIGHCSQADR